MNPSRFSSLPRHARRIALLLTLAAPLAGAQQASDVPDASPAERLVFLAPHLAGLKPPSTAEPNSSSDATP